MTLKEELKEHYNDIAPDYDPAEIETVMEILEVMDDELSNMSQVDKDLLLRMIYDNEELYDKVYNATQYEQKKGDPFDEED